MKTRTRTVAVITALASALFSTGVAGASAASPETPAQARTAQQVRQALAHNPGSRQVNSHAIELDKGVVMDLTLSSCARGQLCVYKNSNYGGGGGGTRWSTCKTQDLRNYSWPDGSRMVASISSIDNTHQYGNVQSRFYDSSNRFMIAVNSGHYLKDLSKDSSATGGSPNDKIYKMKVC